MAFSLTDVLSDYKLVDAGSPRIGLLALALRFEVDDLALVASKSLTEGPNDKKCDLIYIDDISQAAVIVQSYEAGDASRTEAPANKAADLNTAAGWLINRELADVPSEIRPQFDEVREGLASGAIKFLEFWYVHNLPESKNVGDELTTVKETAIASLRTRYSTARCDIAAREVGVRTLESWWRSLQADIAIEDTLDVPIQDAYCETGKDWQAVVASVPAGWLYEQFQKFKTDLFKGNVRDYLGLRESDANINSGIRQTAKEEPEHFFVYNNGVSIITRRAALSEDRRALTIDGMSIVNGAQTTGVLGNLDVAPAESARVQARFIAAADKELVRKIIRYNNSQNRVEPADFRSTDEIQTRLRAEFEASFPTIRYLGGRRGGAKDAIRRDSLLIDSTEVAKALAAFHGMPTLAYNRVKDLWGDENYVKIFPQDVSARHIVFVYSLYRALGEYKASLSKIAESDRTVSQKEQIDLFRSGSAFFCLLAGVGQSSETLLGRAIPSKYTLYFNHGTTMEEVIGLWEVPLRSSVAFLNKFRPVISDRLINEAAVKSTLEDFASSIEAIGPALGTGLADFKRSVAF